MMILYTTLLCCDYVVVRLVIVTHLSSYLSLEYLSSYLTYCTAAVHTCHVSTLCRKVLLVAVLLPHHQHAAVQAYG